MKALSRAGLWLFALIVLAGCASSNVTSYQPYEGSIPRPDRIIVYDFAATPADLPADIAIAGENLAPSAPQTAQQIAVGRKLGAEIAKDLVIDIQDMGLPAVQAAGQPAARVGDLLIMGYFVSVQPGSAAERVVLGFGSGAAKLKTVAKGFLVTAQGLQPLGSGEIEAGSGEMPGGAVPLAVAVATANPVGLVVAGAAKAYGEASGSDTIEGAARRTAQDIADKCRLAAERQGWIQSRAQRSIADYPVIFADDSEVVGLTGGTSSRAVFTKRGASGVGSIVSALLSSIMREAPVRPQAAKALI